MNGKKMNTLTNKLKLSRPLAIFDIESTGLNPWSDHIIELAIVRVEVTGRQSDYTFLVKPPISIPKETTMIHGITDEDVADCPSFAGIVDEVDNILAGCDLAGYNVLHFDIPLLEEEFKRCGRDLLVNERHVLDAQKIYHKKEPRNLSAALRFFCGKEHIDAHGAKSDALATLDVICGEFEKYDDLPQSIEEIEREFNDIDPDNIDRAGRFKWENGEAVVNFGKKKGVPLRELYAEKGQAFLKWMLKANFPSETHEIVRKAMDGVFPERKQ